MPLQRLTDIEVSAALAGAAGELRFIMEECHVRSQVQANLYRAGTNTLRRFAGFDDTVAGFRAAISNAIGLDAADGVDARNDMADLIGAWQAAGDQSKRESALRAEQRNTPFPAAATTLELKSMRTAFEAIYGDCPLALTPGRYFLGTKLEEVVDAEPQVERLEEVTCKEDGEDEFLVPEITKEGAFRVKKGVSKKISAPNDTADLRRRWRLINHAWLFVKTRHGNRAWLADMTNYTYDTLANHILGPTVMSLEACSSLDGLSTPVKPNWGISLKYEYEIRKLCYEFVRKGKFATIHLALIAACSNEECRGLHLAGPFAQQVATTSSRTRPDTLALWQPGNPAQVQSYFNDNGKGKKDKGKGKGKKNFVKHTQMPGPAGQKICFKFNNASGCTLSTCTFSHACQFCLSTSHGAKSCPKKKGKGKGQK